MRKGQKHSKKTLELIRKNRRGKCLGGNNPMKRDEVKLKVSLSQKGIPRPYVAIRNKSPEMREKVRLSKLGRKRPDMVGINNPAKRKEVRMKISNKMMGRNAYWAKGDNNPMKRPDIIDKITKNLIGKKRPDMIGKKNYNYRNGKRHNPYPNGWRTIQQKIRERDRKCVICRVSNKRHIEIYGRQLSVHHIDGDKKNIDQINLVCLCDSHHVKILRFFEEMKDYFYLKIKDIL
jgi:hypothetical protein